MNEIRDSIRSSVSPPGALKARTLKLSAFGSPLTLNEL
jgi:hypothetical protein